MDVAFWTAVGTCLGPTAAVVLGMLAIRNEREKHREAKRRDELVRFLIEAYDDLEHAALRQPFQGDRVERAVARIQLLGSPTQAEMAREFAREFAATNTADLRPLLQLLRVDLRRELALESDNSGLLFFRWTPSLEPTGAKVRPLPKPN